RRARTPHRASTQYAAIGASRSAEYASGVIRISAAAVRVRRSEQATPISGRSRRAFEQAVDRDFHQHRFLNKYHRARPICRASEPSGAFSTSLASCVLTQSGGSGFSPSTGGRIAHAGVRSSESSCQSESRWPYSRKPFATDWLRETQWTTNLCRTHL